MSGKGEESGEENQEVTHSDTKSLLMCQALYYAGWGQLGGVQRRKGALAEIFPDGKGRGTESEKGQERFQK